MFPITHLLRFSVRHPRLVIVLVCAITVDAQHGGWFNSVEGLSALGSLEWVLARVPHVGAVNCLFNDMVRTNSTLVAGLNYVAYRGALRSGRVPLENEHVEAAIKVLSHSTSAPIRERVDGDYRWARVTVFIRDADYSRIDNVLRAAERETLDQGFGFWRRVISYLTVRLLGGHGGFCPEFCGFPDSQFQ